jgi:hypothetical protein
VVEIEHDDVCAVVGVTFDRLVPATQSLLMRLVAERRRLADNF